MEMHEITASKLSKIAIEFKHETNSRRRDMLFLKICEHYMPYIKARLKTINQCDHEELIQIYRIEVYTAITQWEMRSNIETYIFNFVRSVLTKYLKSVRMFKNLDIKCYYLDDIMTKDGNIENIKG